MRAWAWRSRGVGGFTLVELIISTAVLGLVMAGLLGLLTASRRAYTRGSSTVDLQQNLRVALDRMGKEIREGGYHPRAPDTSPTCPPGAGGLYPNGGATNKPCWSFYPIIAQTATAVTLQYDWNGDGIITTAAKVNDPVTCPAGTAVCRGERVTYSLVNSQLMRQEIVVDAAPQPVADGISALTFTYLKDDNTVALTQEDIRSVRIVIQATKSTETPPTTITMMDQIRMRAR